jgi:hypothetical protein
VKKIASIFTKAGYALKANVSDVDTLANGSRKIKVGSTHCFSYSFLRAVPPLFLWLTPDTKTGRLVEDSYERIYSSCQAL